jgi:hypothetical protein
VYNQNASQGQSQYRGMQTSFQPTGFVNSVYGQGQNSNFGGNQSGNMQSYHTAQYKGDQPGHDMELRADSMSPAQQQGQMGSSQNQFSNPQSQFGSQQFGNQPYGTQQMGSQSFGNQQFGGQQSQLGMSSNQFGTQQNQMGRSPYSMSSSSFGGSTPQSSSFGSSNPSINSQQYHTNNYRGNQQGHDMYLRADSINPTQQQQGQFQNQNQNQFQNQNQLGSGFYGRSQ